MTQEVQRLTYVHDGDPGNVGDAVTACKGVLVFGNENSGLLEIDRVEESGPSPLPDQGRSVRINSRRRSELSSLEVAVVGADVPCILAFCGTTAAVVLGPRSLSRCNGTPQDLRGKIRFGAARIGWNL